VVSGLSRNNQGKSSTMKVASVDSITTTVIELRSYAQDVGKSLFPKSQIGSDFIQGNAHIDIWLCKRRLMQTKESSVALSKCSKKSRNVGFAENSPLLLSVPVNAIKNTQTRNRMSEIGSWWVKRISSDAINVAKSLNLNTETKESVSALIVAAIRLQIGNQSAELGRGSGRLSTSSISSQIGKSLNVITGVA
jgi:hypothetical protein